MSNSMENFLLKNNLSLQVVDRIYDILDYMKISEDRLADKLGLPLDKIKEMLSPGYNFSLKELSLLEYHLEFKIVKVPSNTFKPI